MVFQPSLFLFSLTVFYTTVLLVLSLICYKNKIRRNHITFNSLTAIFIMAFLVRLIPVVFFPFGSGHDLNSFIDAGKQISSGQDIYQSLEVRHRYAFLPTYGMVCALFLELSQTTGLDIVILMKLFIVLFDSLLACLIFLISGNIKIGYLYALSPIPIILSAIYGQFDAIPLFFTVLGLYLFSRKKIFRGIISLGVGTAFKPWVLMFLPLLLFWAREKRDQLIMLLSFMLPILISISIYKLITPYGNITMMMAVIARYESVMGWWGPAIFFQKISEATQFSKLLTVPTFISKMITIGLIIFISHKYKSKDIWNTAVLIILTIYIFSLGFGIQYLLWIFPFILLKRDQSVAKYLLFIGLYFITIGLFRNLTYHFSPPDIADSVYYSFSFFVWVFFVILGVRRLRIVDKRLKNYFFSKPRISLFRKCSRLP